MPQLSDDPKARTAEQKCIADVEAYGLHVLRVHGDDQWPEFVYSVGLYHSFGLPEVIILGLKAELAHSILNDLAERAREGAGYRAGEFVSGLLEGFDVTFREVPPEHIWAHCGWAIWYYDQQAFPVLQLVYPTTSGVWPWDTAASEWFRARQPVLETTELPAWARDAS